MDHAVTTPLRDEIAKAIHEAWHDPQHPGHGVLQPEDYACADAAIAVLRRLGILKRESAP